MFMFGMSSQGTIFWQSIYVRTGQGVNQIWLHDRNGTSRLLSEAPWFDLDYAKPVFSMDERYLAYFAAKDYDKSVPESLHIVETSTGGKAAIIDNINPVGWMGWVP